MLLNISNIMCRVILLAMLATYLQYFCLIFIGMMIVCNFIISGFIIKTDGSKHFWTAFSSVLLPNAFISRDTVIILGRRKTRDIFQKFFKANSVLFLLLICVGGYITTNCLITFTDIIHYNCNNVPLLSYKQVYSLKYYLCMLFSYLLGLYDFKSFQRSTKLGASSSARLVLYNWKCSSNIIFPYSCHICFCWRKFSQQEV